MGIEVGDEVHQEKPLKLDAIIETLRPTKSIQTSTKSATTKLKFRHRNNARTQQKDDTHSTKDGSTVEAFFSARLNKSPNPNN